MKYIIGIDRKQTSIFPISMDMSIDKENEVRIIDIYVDSLNMEDMGFNIARVDNGRPAYHPKWIYRTYCAICTGHIVPHKTDVISRPNLHINL